MYNFSLGVSVLDKIMSILFLGLAVLNLVFGLVLVHAGVVAELQELLYAGISLCFSGMLYLYISYGLGKGATWAWVLGVMVLAFNIATAMLMKSIVGVAAYTALLALMVVVAPRYGVGVEFEGEKQVVWRTRRSKRFVKKVGRV